MTIFAGLNANKKMNTNKITLPAEWAEQDAIMLTWPHAYSDWADSLEQVTTCFRNLASEILKRENLIVVCRNPESIKFQLADAIKSSNYKLITYQVSSNDTWARDHSGITIIKNGKLEVLDFTFNGWGLKFAADKDNCINRNLKKLNAFKDDVQLINKKSFVLEGGAIESDGKGTILTTTECLLSPNRNSSLTKDEIDKYLKDTFGAKQILWLNHGYLAGDDTDSHIDTLARLCNENTIAYVTCEDKNDEHYESLKKMEEQLKTFRTLDNKPYNLIPLPMAPVLMDNMDRLPSTYANFLIMNKAVLVPTYGDEILDNKAIETLKGIFPSKEIIGIDCSILVTQHGSLHCVTMQFPKGTLNI